MGVVFRKGRDCILRVMTFSTGEEYTIVARKRKRVLSILLDSRLQRASERAIITYHQQPRIHDDVGRDDYGKP